MVQILNQYVSVKNLLLVLLESVLIACSLLAALKLRFWNEPGETEVFLLRPECVWQVLLVIVTFQLCFYYNDLYNLKATRPRQEQIIRMGQSLGVACLVLGAVYFFVPVVLIGRGVFVITVLLVLLLAMLSRMLLDMAWGITMPVSNVLLLGNGELAVTMAREFRQREDIAVNLLRLDGETLPADRTGNTVLGLSEFVRSHHVSRIIVAIEDRRGCLPVQELVRLRIQGIRVEEAHTAFAALTGRVWLPMIRPSWFVFSEGFQRSRITTAFKRALDLLFSCIGLLVCLPIMLIVAIAIRLDSPGPILYRQRRVGFRGRTFSVLKFRSMRTDAELAGAQWAQQNDPRVTRLGRILRKYRFDEMPQFFNIIKGEMSFVGPRPERPEFVDVLREKIPYYDERHSVRPGLTGWAQVKYSYGASTEDACRKLEYDLFYLKNMSPLMDCAIVFQTVRTVLFCQGSR